MKNILVLGSGFVSKPGIKYLLSQNDFFITVASLSIKYISEIMKGQRNGIAVKLDVNNTCRTTEYNINCIVNLYFFSLIR